MDEQPDTAGGVGTIELTETKPDKTDGDKDRYAHFVRKDKIASSAVSGAPVVALCGKVWVPRSNAANHPVCPRCKAIYESMNKQGPGWPFSDGPSGPAS